MMQFIASILAVNGALRENHHTWIPIEANDRFEAEVIATRVSYRFYPLADGWAGHHVVLGGVKRWLSKDNMDTAEITETVP